MVLVARFLWVHKGKNDPNANAYSNEQQASRLRDRSWARLLTPKSDRGHWIPTLSGMIKAGDESIYSSTLFNGLHKYLGEVPLEQVYDAFANELRARPAAERSILPSEISKFLSTTRRLRCGQSPKATKHGRPESFARPLRNSADPAETGLSRSRSWRAPPPVLVSTFNVLAQESGNPTSIVGSWAQDLQHALYFDGRLSVQMSMKDLAALSVILGSPVSGVEEKETQKQSFMSRGAFGISISASATASGNYHVSLTQHKRSISQLPARGSGYSILYAKHLASGSLPFSQDEKTVSSIVITNETVEAIKSGTLLCLQKSNPQSKASTFLVSLPNSRKSSLYILTPSSTSTSTPLLQAIATLPFTGGLTPLVSSPLVNTVQFAACGGLVPGRLLQRLDALVEKVHRHSPHLQLFGPLFEDSNAGLLYREHERLGKLATKVVTEEPLSEKAARVHRYITMLERLMALVPDMKPAEVLMAVKEATQKEIERSYDDAVAAYTGNNGEDVESSTTPESKRRSILSQRSVRRSKRSSTLSTGLQTPTSVMSSHPSSTFLPNNLERPVEGILKAPLPYDIQTIALVARMVLVAWTLSVETVAWDDGEEGFKVPNVGVLPENMYMW